MIKILAIDDQQDNLTTITAVLKSQIQDCKVITALSGKEGIELAQEEQPDTILLDIIMPNMDGYEVCSKLKEDKLTKHIPVVMVTAIRTDAESRIKGLNIGADAFLSKPIDPIELSAQVMVMLRIKAAEDRLRADKKNLSKTVLERTDELKESEEKFRMMVQNSPDLIMIQNPKGELLYISKQVENILGYKLEDCNGEIFSKIIHPKDREIAHKTMHEALNGRVVEDFEYRIIGIDKQIKWLSHTSRAIKKNGEIIAIQSNVRNITTRKTYEEKLSENEHFLNSIFDSVQDGISVLNPDLTVRHVNATMNNWYSENRPLEGRKCHEVYHNSDKPCEICPTLRSFKSGKAESNIIPGLPGSNIDWLELFSYPIIDPESRKVTGVVEFVRDISDRKRMEEKVQDSKEQYKDLVEKAGIAVLIDDEEGNFTFFNDKFTDLFGYSSEEIKTKSIRKLVHPDDIDMVMKFHKSHLLDKKISSRYEFRGIKKDGSTIFLEVDAIKVKGEKGIVGTRSYIWDITDRKLAEESKRESEEKYKALYNDAPLAYQSLDIEGHFIDVNPTWLKMLGYKRDDVIGKSFADFLHEDMVPHFKKNFPKFKKRGYIKDVQFKIRCKDTHYMDISFEGCVGYHPDGSFKQTYCVFQDITDRKRAEQALYESEQKYRFMATNTLDTVWTTDLEVKMTFVNDAIFKFLGYTTEEFMGLNPSVFTPPEGLKAIQEAVEQLYAKYLKGEISQAKFEIQQYKKDGTLIDVEIRTNPLLDNEGKIIGFQGRSVDISEAKRAELIQKVLYNISNAVSSTDNLSKLIQSIQEELGKIIDTTNFYVALYDKENDTLTLPFFTDQKDEFTSFPAGKTLTNYVIKTQKTLLANKEKLEQLQRSGKVGNFGTNPEIWLGVPLKVEGKVTGVLAIQSYTNDSAYNKSDMKMLEFIADQISISIDRKKAEDEISKLSTAVKQSPSVIAITDLNGDIIYANPKFTELTGYSLEETMGQNPRILKSGVQNEKEYSYLWETITSGKEWRGEFHNKKKNGELFWESASVSPIFDNNGKITNYLKVAEDITESKRKEEIQKILYNISTSVITSKNLKDLYIQIQKEIGSIIDTTNFYIAFYDQKTDTLSLPFYSDEKDNFTIVPAGKTLTKYVIDTKKPLLANIELKNKLVAEGKLEYQGTLSKIWLGVPLLIDGKVTGALAVQSYTDEFAYDESDMEMLEFVADQISISIDRKKSEEDIAAALLKAEESDRLKSAFLANMSHEIRTPMNGLLGFAGLLKEPELDSNKQEKYIDIIERSGERMLNIINDLIDISKIEAQQMDVSISSTNVNHEIEDLYNFFKPEAEKKGMQLMRSTTLSDSDATIKTDKEKLFAILTNLIKNSIKYSDEGSIEFGYNLISVTSTSSVSEDLTSSVSEDLTSSISEDLTSSVSEDLTSSISEDLTSSVSEDLTSSISEDSKSSVSEDSKSSVSEDSAVEPVETTEIEFYVKDTGIGIPKNRQEAIFDRFVQADIEDTQVREGSGLGLSISKAYVEMLGGRIWLESQEGIGSQFNFTIPYVNKSVESPNISLPENENQSTNETKNLKILIVEDDEIADIFLTEVLEQISNNILHAKNGTDGIELCKNNEDIDLIMMDIKMPDMDGYEATTKIREFNKDVPIIAQTAYALSGDREKAIKAGCNDYVSKPINMEELIGKISKLIKK